jgi:hypothetical protein
MSKIISAREYARQREAQHKSKNYPPVPGKETSPPSPKVAELKSKLLDVVKDCSEANAISALLDALHEVTQEEPTERRLLGAVAIDTATLLLVDPCNAGDKESWERLGVTCPTGLGDGGL